MTTPTSNPDIQPGLDLLGYRITLWLKPGVGTPHWYADLDALKDRIAWCLATSTPFTVGHQFRVGQDNAIVEPIPDWYRANPKQEEGE